MNRNTDELDRKLDRTLEQISSEQMPDELSQVVSERVWSRLEPEIGDSLRIVDDRVVIGRHDDVDAKGSKRGHSIDVRKRRVKASSAVHVEVGR